MPRATRSGWTRAAGHPPPLPAGLPAAAQRAFYMAQFANAIGSLNISTLDKDPKLTFYSSAGGVQKRRAERAYFASNTLLIKVYSNYVSMSSLKARKAPRLELCIHKQSIQSARVTTVITFRCAWANCVWQGDRTSLAAQQAAGQFTWAQFRNRVNHPSTTKVPENGTTWGVSSDYRWAKTSGEMPPAQAWLDDIGPCKLHLHITI